MVKDERDLMIVSHSDADGIISAHLLKTWYNQFDKASLSRRNIHVIFPKIHNFDVPDYVFDTETDLAVLDLGTNLDKIVKENEIAKAGNDVIHIDHPLENFIFLNTDTILGKGMKEGLMLHPNLNLIHNLENCTAGLTFLRIIESGKLLPDWYSIWAGIGVLADVALSTKGGQEVLNYVRKDFPFLFGYWVKDSLAGFEEMGEARIPYMTTIGRFLNFPRKIAFDLGPEVALKACEEIDRLGSFDVLFRSKPDIDALAPNAALLRNWEIEYSSELGRIIKEKDYNFFDFTTHAYCIINHKWHLGPDLARLLSRREKKTVLALNFGLQDVILVNGRSPKESKFFDLGRMFLNIKKESSLMLEGGGHALAAACSFQKIDSPEKIINLIEKEFRRWAKVD